MNKKIFLTSAVIMCMACPAFAESFPNDGNMLENKTYANAAVYDNTGIYEGTVVANADYSDNLYTVLAGYYLPANSENPNTQCTAGNFCPGLQSQVLYDANNAQGLTSCATVGDTTYTQSAVGATSETDCYKACTTVNVAHSASVTGNDYYGAGVDTCSATSCDSGYHTYSSTPDFKTLIGKREGIANGYIDNEGTAQQQATTYGLTSIDKNYWVVDYGADKGVFFGHAACSTTPGTMEMNGEYSTFSVETTLTDETGHEGAGYCYCQINGYKASSEASLENMTSSWVFCDNLDTECASGCARFCANNMKGAFSISLAYRATLLGAIPSGPATCEANTINITWNDASAEDIAATGAATTVYEGDIKTPLKAVTKPGKTFVGWKFIKPTNPAPVQGEGD